MEYPTVEVTLSVTGIDLDDESTAELLGARFPLILWEERPGLTLMTLNVAAPRALDEAVITYRDLARAVPALRLVGVHRDLVTTSQIAARVGVSREAVRKWTSRSDFPAVFDCVGIDFQRLWAWTQIVEWLRTRRGVLVDDSLLRLEEMSQLETALARVTSTAPQWKDLPAAGRPSPRTTTATMAQVVRLKPAMAPRTDAWATPATREKVS